MLLLSQERCFWVEALFGRALTMQWMSGINLTKAAIWVTDNLSAYVGRGYPASAYKQSAVVALKYPVIILQVSFREVSTCLDCLERPHEEQTSSAIEKQIANEVVRTVAGWAPHLEVF